MSNRQNYNRMSYVSDEEKEVFENYIEPKSDFSFQANPEVESLGDRQTLVGYVANCNKLNLREIPSKDGKVITILNAGTILSLGDTNAEWCTVLDESGEIRGYVMSKYVEL